MEGVVDAFQYAANPGAGPSSARGRSPVSETPSVPDVDTVTGRVKTDTGVDMQAGGRPDPSDPTKGQIAIPGPTGDIGRATEGHPNRKAIKQFDATTLKQYNASSHNKYWNKAQKLKKRDGPFWTERRS